MVLALVCSFLLLLELTFALGAGALVSAVGCDWVWAAVFAVPVVVPELAASAGAAIREVAIRAAEIVFSMVVSFEFGIGGAGLAGLVDHGCETSRSAVNPF